MNATTANGAAIAMMEIIIPAVPIRFFPRRRDATPAITPAIGDNTAMSHKNDTDQCRSEDIQITIIGTKTRPNAMSGKPISFCLEWR